LRKEKDASLRPVGVKDEKEKKTKELKESRKGM
jgi:hypothetical protein